MVRWLRACLYIACFGTAHIACAAECPDEQFAVDLPRGSAFQALLLLDKQSGCKHNFAIAAALSNATLGPLKGQYRYSEALDLLVHETPWAVVRMANGLYAMVPRPKGPPPPTKGQRPRAHTTPRPASDVSNTRIEEVVTTAGRYKSRPEMDVAIPSPTIVFDEQQIKQFGVSTVGDLMKYLSQQPYSRGTGYHPNGAQYADVRGLGGDATLILINGRRATASAGGSTSVSAFDLNTIPLTAVEEVQVSADAPSVTYGADALGGIVNIILKRDIFYPQVALHYGSAEDGAQERRITMQDGWGADAWYFTALVDYFDRTELVGADREYWRDQDYRRFGGTDWRSQAASPANVLSLTSDNLPGLSTASGAVAPGTTGAVNIGDFVAGAENRESLLKYWSVSPYTERLSIWSSMGWLLSPRVEAFGELLYADRSTINHVFPPTMIGPLPASNAYNPFGAPVFVAALLTDLGPRQIEVPAKLERLVAGLKGNTGRWRWEGTITRSVERGEVWVNDVDPLRFAEAIASPNRSIAVNVFAPDEGDTADLVEHRSLGPLFSKELIARGTIAGQLIETPTHNVSAEVGAEWRENESSYGHAILGKKRRMSAAFGQITFALGNELSLDGSTRLDNFDAAGLQTGHQFGVRWVPLPTLALRSSYASTYRLPSIGDLYVPHGELTLPFFDPKRREVTPVTLLTGGNPHLRATTGKTLSAKLEFQSPAVSRLKLNAGYWRITVNDRVSLVPIDTLLQHEDRYPERFVRAAPTSLDEASSRAGVLQTIDITNGNFGRLITSGVDLSASAQFQTRAGSVTPELNITRTLNYRTEDLAGIDASDRVGIASDTFTIPRWRAVANVQWMLGALRASTTLRYVAAYDDTRSGIRTGRKVPDQLLTDLQVAIAVPATSPQPFEVTVGAANLLNEKPHFSEVDGQWGYDLSQGDLRQRFAYLRISKDF